MSHCIRLALVFTFIFSSDLASAGGKHKPDFVTETIQSSKPPLLETPSEFPISQIDFEKSCKGSPRFASIAIADPVKKCPLESLPEDLASIVDQLTLRVRESVAKIKAARGSHCTALANRLTASQAQLGVALKNQYTSKPPIGSPATTAPSYQDSINTQTQRAGATNQLVLTVSDLVQRECLSSIDDRIVIQRLVGQIVTLGGLFWGGWQGIIAAVGGQLFGNLPIFTDEMDAVLKAFRQYDEKTERGSFLCLFRQMQKTSCSLFSKPEDTLIAGFDLTFGSGPALITLNSIEEIKKTAPKEFHDAVELHKIQKNFAPFLSLIEQQENLLNGSIEAVQELRQACTQYPPEAFQSKGSHPPQLETSLTTLIATCDAFNTFRWANPTSEDFGPRQDEIFWSLLSLSSYYEQLRKTDTELSKIVQTYESLVYFQNLKSTFEEYQDPAAGNQTRLTYLKLTEKLGKTIAKSSFTKLMKDNWKAMKKCSHSHRDQGPALPLRQRALTAMLDLCQTLDPTLTCLHVEDPTHTQLQKRWMKNCVGPKSLLCREVLDKTELGIPLREVLLIEPAYRAYFDSLCGKPKASSPASQNAILACTP